jgi:arginine decarboxylase-like protein
MAETVDRDEGETGVEPTEDAWNVERSAELYQIEGWGQPYFHVSEAGDIHVRPDPDVDQEINLHDLVASLEARGLDMPLLLRFSDILRHRIRRLNASTGGATRASFPSRSTSRAM